MSRECAAIEQRQISGDWRQAGAAVQSLSATPRCRRWVQWLSSGGGGERGFPGMTGGVFSGSGHPSRRLWPGFGHCVRPLRLTLGNNPAMSTWLDVHYGTGAAAGRVLAEAHGCSRSLGPTATSTVHTHSHGRRRARPKQQSRRCTAYSRGSAVSRAGVYGLDLSIVSGLCG